jgi:hypothetical protein
MGLEEGRRNPGLFSKRKVTLPHREALGREGLPAEASAGEGGFDSFKPLVYLPQLLRRRRFCIGRRLA